MNHNQVYRINSIWYSWIPTNLGRLSFEYIGEVAVSGYKYSVNQLEQDKKQITIFKTNLSDLNIINNFFQGIEEKTDKASIEIQKKSSFFVGKVSLYYNDAVKISGDFSVDLSGETKIFDVSVTYDTEQVNTIVQSEVLDQTIVNAIYTILKKVIHGDNHHRQKIDTLIGVYKNNFEPIKILDSFATNIKSRERIVKDGAKNNCYYTQEKIVSSIEIDGYLSYIETFKELFCPAESQEENQKSLRKEWEQKIKFIKNVAQSLKASTEKIKFTLDLRQKTLTLFMTFIAFFVSVNIFHNGFYSASGCSNISSGINYIVWSFFIVLSVYLMTMRFICISRTLSSLDIIWEYLRYKALYDKDKKTAISTFLLSLLFVFLFLYTLKELMLFTLTKLMN